MPPPFPKRRSDGFIFLELGIRQDTAHSYHSCPQHKAVGLLLTRRNMTIESDKDIVQSAHCLRGMAKVERIEQSKERKESRGAGGQRVQQRSHEDSSRTLTYRSTSPAHNSQGFSNRCTYT